MGTLKKTIGDIFDDTIEKYPDKEGLKFQNQSFSYNEMAKKVEGLAKAFIGMGIKKDEKIGIWMPNYPEWIFTNLANAKIGAVTVPINIRFKAREVGYILKNAQITTLVMADKFLSNNFLAILEELCPELKRSSPGNLKSAAFPDLKNIICLTEIPGTISFNKLVEQGNASKLDRELKNRQSTVQPDDVVNVFYTSGTTGLPKGAMADHNILMNIHNYIKWLKITKQDVFLVPSPLFYTTANYWCMLCPIMAGAKMCLATYFTMEEKFKLISQEKVTITVGMAKTWVDMLAYLKQNPYDTSSLRIGWTGGGPITLEELNNITKHIVTDMISLYGMTETGGITTMTKIGDPLELLSKTIGTPLPNFELKLIDPDTGKDPSPGKPGELCVKGPYVIKGYLNMSQEEQAIYFDQDGWYHTQDLLLEHSNGYFSFVGRIKDMIKVGGENVSLNEIDEFLRTHEKIKMACSIGVPDPAKQEVALAFIELEQDAQMTETEIQEYCRGKIASYKIPKYIKFTNEWPTTATGKIQRFKLSEKVKDEFKI